MKSVFIRGQRYEERFLLLERKLESCEMNFLHGHRRSRRSCLQIKEKVVGKLILKRNTQILGRSLGIAESKGWKGEGQDQELISTKTILFELLSLPPSFPHPFQNRKCEKMIFWGKKRKRMLGIFCWEWIEIEMQGIEIGASRVGNGQDGDLLVGILVAANIRECLGISWEKIGN